MKKKPGLARVGELAATGVALIAEPITGSLSLLARLATLTRDQMQATQSQQLLDRVFFGPGAGDQWLKEMRKKGK